MGAKNLKQKKKSQTKPRRISKLGSPRSQQEKFLRRLFPGDDPVIDVRVMEADGPLKRTPCVGVEAAMEATALGVEASCNVYVGVASRTEAGSEKGKGGKEKGSGSCFPETVFIDLSTAIWRNDSRPALQKTSLPFLSPG